MTLCSDEVQQLMPWLMQHLEPVVERSTKPNVITPTVNTSASSSSPPACKCSRGCRSSRCGCVLRSLPCSSDCQCKKTHGNCNNYATVLHEMGFKLADCLQDQCFMSKMAAVRVFDWPESDISEILSCKQLNNVVRNIFVKMFLFTAKFCYLM